MRLLICGDRNWTDKDAVLRRATALKPDTIIHGCARGADTIAGCVGGELGIDVLEFPADWNKFGRAAGMIRNQQMLDEGKPDYVLAFHDSYENSKGTKNMVERAISKGICVEVWHHTKSGETSLLAFFPLDKKKEM